MKLNKIFEKSNKYNKFLSSGIHWDELINSIYLNPYLFIRFHNFHEKFHIRIKFGADGIHGRFKFEDYQ